MLQYLMAGAFQSNRSNVPDVMPPVVTYRDVVMSFSPVAYWKLDEASGTTAADQTGTYPGTASGAVTPGQPGALPTYPSQTAFGFNNGYVEVTTPILNASANYTIIAFVRGTPTNISGGRAIYCERGPTGNNILKLEYAKSTPAGAVNQIAATLRDNNAGSLLQINGTGSNLRDGNWHQVALTRSGTAILLYVDGVQVGSGTFTGTTYTNANRVSRIGADRGDSTAFQIGDIDEVALFTTTLTGPQISSIYAAR